LRQALAELLKVASPAGPSLARAASRAAAGDLPFFVAELERALVPVNRTAARRALQRLGRETERARREGRLEAAASLSEAEAVPKPAPALDAAPPPPPAVPVVAPRTEAAPSLDPVPPPPPVVAAPVLPPTAFEETEPSTSPETVVALTGSGRPPPRDPHSERTPYIGSLGLEVLRSEPVVLEGQLSPDLPTVAPPPYGGAPLAPRGVGELVESFEVAPPLSDDSLRSELKRLAGVEGTPGPEAVSSAPRRST
jgi:hypothetical protein